jgi:hypothetical protein
MPLSTPSRQFLNARQLSVEYNPVAPDGHARQDGEVAVAVVGLLVVVCTVGVWVGIVDGLEVVGLLEGLLVGF